MKIYVGNLSYRTTAESLEKMFRMHGDVQDIAIATDKETEKSRGFCFVFMKDEDEAKKAIRMLNGRLLDGRTIKVSLAADRKQQAREKQRATGHRRRAFSRGSSARPHRSSRRPE